MTGGADRPEDALLVAAAGGDEAAFAAVYDRFSRPLYALGLRWLQDVEDAEELVNDTLIRVWAQADRFDPVRGRASAWLFGIARHVATDRLRARGRRPITVERSVPKSGGYLDVDGLADAWEVAAALERLPDVQREVLLMAYRDDLSQSQIAQALGVPLGTIKSRTYYALRAMAGLVAPPDSGLGQTSASAMDASAVDHG